MNEQRFNELFTLYLEGRNGKEEWEELMQMIKSGLYDIQLRNRIDMSFESSNQLIGIPSVKREEIACQILTSENYRYGFRHIAAAILILVLAGVTYMSFHGLTSNRRVSDLKKYSPKPTNNIPSPKISGAVLTLGDGKTIQLSNTQSGRLATEGKVEVIKKENGAIVYKGQSGSAITYNTLSVPKGSMPIQLALADGSLVWLNAASAITYPTAFVGKERRVNIDGEAYFEIAKNASKPFFVSNRGMVVKVLGTHFNVNTYENEKDAKVTLLEGSIDVSVGGNKSVLRPGQQASLSNYNIKVVNTVDLNEVMSWKNNQFYFRGADIQTIMRRLERYYNIDVQYKDEVKYKFAATIPMDVNISEFLNKLELTKLIHFRIEGNKVIVMK